MSVQAGAVIRGVRDRLGRSRLPLALALAFIVAVLILFGCGSSPLPTTPPIGSVPNPAPACVVPGYTLVSDAYLDACADSLAELSMLREFYSIARACAGPYSYLFRFDLATVADDPQARDCAACLTEHAAMCGALMEHACFWRCGGP